MTAPSEQRTKRIYRIRKRTAPGSAPGTLKVDPQAPKPVIRVIAYDPDKMKEEEIHNLEEIGAFLEHWPVTWVNVDGLGDAETILKLGELFQLHGLALEDVVHVTQRPKVEDYGSRLFLVTRMVGIRGGESARRLETEQISLFLGERFVLTFQERPGDCLDCVRDRIRKGAGRIRQAGPDYLAYALLDAVIDNYFPVLEQFGEHLEELETTVLSNPDETTVPRIHETKRELLGLRRAMWPQREAMNSLLRDGTSLISEETKTYLRDCYDHTVQIIDLLENYREIASGLMDVYLSSVSNRMNEVMKVLTIFAAIFIPLTFIAGIYGMNFNTERSPWNLPELNWTFGYPFALGLMAAIGVGMLVYFRHKGWMGPRRPKSKE